MRPPIEQIAAEPVIVPSDVLDNSQDLMSHRDGASNAVMTRQQVAWHVDHGIYSWDDWITLNQQAATGVM